MHNTERPTPVRPPWGGLRALVFGGNVYDRAELAGAFGDLGTFIAFVAAYISINQMDPAGILLSFGAFQLAVGLVYKTPVSVQPMKAIGGAAIANPAAFSHGAIWGAGLFTAVVWTVLGLTGAVTWLQRLTSKPVVRGIMLGLGLSFCLEGARQMAPDLLLAVPAVVLALFLLNSRRLPAMLALLVVGVAVSLAREPALAGDLGRMALHFRLPEMPLGQLSWNDLAVGALVLGLPQVPLTLGNAVIGTAAENNEIFPDRPLQVKTLALSHGVMNFAAAAVGGVPLCHGAGGMAGHVRFGARTGGALVMLGLFVTFLGLFLADSVTLLFSTIPAAILGVILFFTGLELAATVRDIGQKKDDVYVMLLTAALAMVNMGVAFVAGLALYHALQRRLVRL
ncbi:MAG: putative sulfate/molybdate transporter [Chloroflexota bacterium]